MIADFDSQMGRNGGAPRQFSLGSLESAVMQALWQRGECSVRGVYGNIGRPLAYTTVMTTLERLYKKGLLRRRKDGRAFLYTPALSQHEWEQRRAGDLVANILSSSGTSRDLLVSCLVEAVGQEDDSLLKDLERKIRQKRRDLSRRSEK
jgi:predicted transcriptional regulator